MTEPGKSEDRPIIEPGSGGKQVEIRTKWVLPGELKPGDVLIEPNATVNAAILTKVYECNLATHKALLDSGVEPEVAKQAVAGKMWRIEYEDPHAKMGSFVAPGMEVEIEVDRRVL